MQDHADRVAQPAGIYPGLATESTFCTETLQAQNQENGVLSTYPYGSSIEAYAYSVLGHNNKNTVSIWDVAEKHIFTLRYANPPFFLLMGRTQEEALGKPLDEIIDPTRRQICKRFIECLQSRHEVDFLHEQFGRFLVTRLSPLVKEGRIVLLIGTSTDITEYFQDHIRLKAYNKQIKQQSLLLNARLKFESLIARALREFMDSGIKGFDGCLCGLNRELGMMMDADQALIFQRRTENLCIHKACWLRDNNRIYNCTSHIRNIQEDRSSLTHISRLLVINDTRRDHGFPCAQELSEMGIRALLAVPICRESHVYGLLFLTQKKPRVWTTADISMAKTAADTIMSAYLRLHLEKGLSENIRVLTEYDESLQDLLAQKETLADVSQNFLRTGLCRFAESARAALENIGRLLDADGVRMLLRSPDGDTEIFEWQEKGLPCYIGREHDSLNAAALSAAVRQTEPIVMNDTSEALPLPELSKAAAGEGLRSLLVMPACRPNGLTGVMICFKVIGFKYWQRADLISADAFTDIFIDAYQLKKESEAVIACDNLYL